MIDYLFTDTTAKFFLLIMAISIFFFISIYKISLWVQAYCLFRQPSVAPQQNVDVIKQLIKSNKKELTNEHSHLLKNVDDILAAKLKKERSI